MARLMDFTTETPDCCEIGDALKVEEYKLPTSFKDEERVRIHINMNDIN